MRLLLLIILFMPVNGCKDKTIMDKEVSKLVYEVSSRGYYRYIEINREQLSVSNNRDKKNLLTRKLNYETWHTLVSKLEEVQIEQINTVGVSTDESASDRSAIGELTVYVGEKGYSSPMFDHNNPPDELKGLIAQMVALAETVE